VTVGKGKWQEAQEKLRGVQEKRHEKRQESARLEAERAQEAMDAVYAGWLEEARAGAERGDPFFSFTLTEVANKTSHAAFLGSVEELGWRLKHVDHVYVPKESSTSSTFGSGSGASQSTHSGVVQVYYLFRRL
jgi:hypothetical protein